MKKFLVAAAFAALATPVVAQMAPAAPMGAPGAPMAMPVPTTLEGFRRMAMASDAFEIESSRLALERSRNSIVRRYAQDMIRDHSMTTHALMGGGGMHGGTAAAGAAAGSTGGAVAGGLAGAALGGPVGAVIGAGIGAGAGAGAGAGGVDATGSVGMRPALDARKAAMLQQLSGLSGSEFDRAYGDMQRMSHREAIALFSGYLQTGTDPNGRAFAEAALPHLQNHLARAQRLPGGGMR